METSDAIKKGRRAKAPDPEQSGQAGLAHGNRGRLSARRIPEAIRKEILELARSRYQDYNDTHFTEKLEELHDINYAAYTEQEDALPLR